MKQTIQKQYAENVMRAKAQLAGLTIPAEGWVSTVRKALGLSGAALARRLGVTRAMVNHHEKSELDGSITLNSLQKIAHAMDCEVIYAIIPNTSIDDIRQQQALNKAYGIVIPSHIQMALEAQALTPEQLKAQLAEIAKKILEGSDRELWSDE